MSSKHKRRLDKLEAPDDREAYGPMMHIFYAAQDMPLETAMKILDIRPKRNEQVLCFGILPPGSPPSIEPPSDELLNTYNKP